MTQECGRGVENNLFASCFWNLWGYSAKYLLNLMLLAIICGNVWLCGLFFAAIPSLCGRNSVVECQLPKLNVEGSNPFARFFAVACNVSQVVAQGCKTTRVTHIISAIPVVFALTTRRNLSQRIAWFRTTTATNIATTRVWVGSRRWWHWFESVGRNNCVVSAWKALSICAIWKYFGRVFFILSIATTT